MKLKLNRWIILLGIGVLLIMSMTLGIKANAQEVGNIPILQRVVYQPYYYDTLLEREIFLTKKITKKEAEDELRNIIEKRIFANNIDVDKSGVKEVDLGKNFTMKKITTQKKYVSSVSGVNIRLQPTKESDIYKTLPLNSEILIIDGYEENGWNKVFLDKRILYISSSCVSSEKTVLQQKVSSTSSNQTATVTSGENGSFLGNYQLTAYTHTGNNTASGAYPTVGMVACNSLPLGTRVVIYGREYVVADRGSQAVMGNHVIDIFMDSYDECIQFGRHYDVPVYLAQ